MSLKNVMMDKDNFEEMSLNELLLKIKEWYLFLLSKWLIILIFSIMGALIGFVYASWKKAVYKATTTFVLESGEGGGGLGQYVGVASMMGIDLGSGGGGLFQGENILELYKSRTMIESVLLSKVIINGKSQLLIDRYIEINDLRKLWAKNDKLKNLDFNAPNEIYRLKINRLRDSVLGSAVKDINLNYLTVTKPDKKLNIIRVDVKSNDEFFAKSFNDQIVKNVNDFYIQTKTKKSLQNVEILENKADSVRRVMNGAIYSAAAVADATPNLNPTRQIQRAAPLQRSQFSAETNKAILGELVKNLEMSKMGLLKETPLIQVVDVPIYPLEKIRPGKLISMIIGGFLFGFLVCLVLVLNKIYKKIISND